MVADCACAGLFGVASNSSIEPLVPLEQQRVLQARDNAVKPMQKSPVYKVIFYNQNQVYEVFARAIYQSEMYGFIEVEEFVFGERSQLLVDPGEEKLKGEFASVKRSYIPLHSIIRIDEVEKEGTVKVSEVKPGEKTSPIPFPSPIHTPHKD